MVHEIPTTPIGVCGRHHCFPVVTLVGANKEQDPHVASGHRRAPPSSVEPRTRAVVVRALPSEASRNVATRASRREEAKLRQAVKSLTHEQPWGELCPTTFESGRRQASMGGAVVAPPLSQASKQ